MKMRYILIAAILIVPYLAISQNDSTIKANVFTAGINYQSRLHFFGRTDNLKSSGLFPSVGFETKFGPYINTNFIFVNNTLSSFDYNGTIIEAGYKFPTTKNFSGNIFYNQFLYKNQSELVQSALKSQTGINLTYNNKIVNVNAGADAKFSDKTDYGVTVGVDRLFIHLIPNTKNALAFNPSIYAYAGSQNFSRTYREKHKILGTPIPGRTITENETRFNWLAYEVSLPIVFVSGKFNVSLTPSYISPQNLIVYPNQPALSEIGENMFYITAGVGVRL